VPPRVGVGDEHLLGQTVAGRWELMERIGDGGMGVVFRARDLRARAGMVAVKVLSEKLTRDPSWVKRFENEARAIEQLHNPSTVRFLEHGRTDEGRLYLVMELLSGRSLRDVLDREAPLPPERVLRVLMEVCPPLAEAHQKGIFHRDLKPDNLFIQPGDRVKVLDFSVAKLRGPEAGIQTAAGIIFGTPQYMAPEQGRGLPVDARSDLYSLGMIAFEMLAGAVPFTHRDPMTVLAMQVRDPLPALPSAVPDAVADLVRKLCAKDPGERFQSATELEAACRQVLRASLRRAPTAAPERAPEPEPASEPASEPAAGDQASLGFWIACVGGGAAAGLFGYYLFTLIS
jgi:serine/threonine-protein kinase